MCLLFSTALLNIFPCRNLCPNGTYSLGAQIKCTLCLPGSKCPSITEGPTICPPGYFSERNAEDCKLCEAGKQCADPACKINLNSEKVITSPAYVKRVCSEVQKTIIIAVIILLNYCMLVSFSSWAMSSRVLFQHWLDTMFTLQKGI